MFKSGSNGTFITDFLLKDRYTEPGVPNWKMPAFKIMIKGSNNENTSNNVDETDKLLDKLDVIVNKIINKKVNNSDLEELQKINNELLKNIGTMTSEQSSRFFAIMQKIQ